MESELLDYVKYVSFALVSFTCLLKSIKLSCMSFLMAFEAKVATDATEFASEPFKAEDLKEAILHDR